MIDHEKILKTLSGIVTRISAVSKKVSKVQSDVTSLKSKTNKLEKKADDGVIVLEKTVDAKINSLNDKLEKLQKYVESMPEPLTKAISKKYWVKAGDAKRISKTIPIQCDGPMLIELNIINIGGTVEIYRPNEKSIKLFGDTRAFGLVSIGASPKKIS